jgi:hypothetical protein
MPTILHDATQQRFVLCAEAAFTGQNKVIARSGREASPMARAEKEPSSFGCFL